MAASYPNGTFESTMASSHAFKRQEMLSQSDKVAALSYLSRNILPW
jgi:hypothetical protein